MKLTRLPFLFCMLFLACLCGLLLPSCGLPITARVIGPNGALSYNDEAGLGVEIDARPTK